jgi:hypothetical protein
LALQTIGTSSFPASDVTVWQVTKPEGLAIFNDATETSEILRTMPYGELLVTEETKGTKWMKCSEGWLLPDPLSLLKLSDTTSALELCEYKIFDLFLMAHSKLFYRQYLENEQYYQELGDSAINNLIDLFQHAKEETLVQVGERVSSMYQYVDPVRYAAFLTHQQEANRVWMAAQRR